MGASVGPWEPLVDRFGRRHTYLRVSLTDRCNFRCRYCMPAEGVVWKPRDEILTLEEIVRLVGVFARIGVDKVRLTGGEPTVRKGLEGLIASLSAVPGIKTLLMTTNGTSLAQKASAYRSAGLDGLNVSMDSLQPDKFSEITLGGDLDRVLQGVRAARSSGFEPLKVNVVAMKGVNDDELADFVAWGIESDVHVRFIEFMPFLGNEWKKGGVLTYKEMLERIQGRFVLKPLTVGPSAVAKEFTVEGTHATVGFVTSVTDDFCGGCNRIRLTAEGQVKTCLFLKAGPSLRDMMRAGASDDDLALTVHAALATKWAGHPPMERLVGLDDKAMVQIGG
ncbi:MAG: GTP 3',8-cyclase MoaA [Armatimonadetes bacterium]|nr:GTP 3',8-cyclase MoaA [Armatimonadota bacterium]